MRLRDVVAFAAVRARSIVVCVVVATLFCASGASAQPRGMDAGVPSDASAGAVPDAGPAGDASAPADAGDTDAAAVSSESRYTEARALYVAGRAAMQGGRFADARAHFVRAWELTGRPFLLYDIGRACDLLRRDAEALEAFQRYLHAVPDAANRDEVRGRVEVLRRSVRQSREHAATAPAPTTAAHRNGDPSVLETWWFWTIIGAVVVSAVAIIITVSTDRQTRPPIPGDLPAGGVIEALEAP